ncbi:hypothetical protein HYW21_00455 [Candidatus Woesearchaeota archaeon]|nr:hypothetical protein [Candidatus Woesearchaeota archaeon]
MNQHPMNVKKQKENSFSCRSTYTNTGVVRKVDVLHSIKQNLDKVSGSVRGILPNNAKYIF